MQPGLSEFAADIHDETQLLAAVRAAKARFVVNMGQHGILEIKVLNEFVSVLLRKRGLLFRSCDKRQSILTRVL